MGAGQWVAGGIRRAVDGVLAVLPTVRGPLLVDRGHPTPAAGQPGTADADVVGVDGAPRRLDQARAPLDAAQATGDVAAAGWTEDEVADFRRALADDLAGLTHELTAEQADLAELVADAAGDAGEDQADAGARTLDREQEMSVVANSRDLLDQAARAMRRLEEGSYGVCEACGTRIPAARLRAFPRATLCVPCKQAEERRPR